MLKECGRVSINSLLTDSLEISSADGLTVFEKSKEIIIIAASSLNVIIGTEMTSERLCLMRSENKCSAFV